jgi:hypothetical protein
MKEGKRREGEIGVKVWGREKREGEIGMKVWGREKEGMDPSAHHHRREFKFRWGKK